MPPKPATAPHPRLVAIAHEVHRLHEADEYQSAQWATVEAQLAIGRLLGEARALLPSDNAYGRWLDQQHFAFSQQWAWTLRAAAEREAEVRQVVTSQLVTGAANIEKAVAEVRRRGRGRPLDRLDVMPDEVDEIVGRLLATLDELRRVVQPPALAAWAQQGGLRRAAEDGRAVAEARTGQPVHYSPARYPGAEQVARRLRSGQAQLAEAAHVMDAIASVVEQAAGHGQISAGLPDDLPYEERRRRIALARLGLEPMPTATATATVDPRPVGALTAGDGAQA